MVATSKTHTDGRVRHPKDLLLRVGCRAQRCAQGTLLPDTPGERSLGKAVSWKAPVRFAGRRNRQPIAGSASSTIQEDRVENSPERAESVAISGRWKHRDQQADLCPFPSLRRVGYCSLSFRST